MRVRLTVTILVLVVLAGVTFYASTYQIIEGKQAVITQFGRPTRFVTDAGLHFKVPFIEEVHRLEKRLLPWDGAAESMQTSDKKRIFIDVWARWHIVDAKEFFRAVRTEEKGQKILDDLVDSAVRNVVAKHTLIEVVRTTDDDMEFGDEAEMGYGGKSLSELARSVSEEKTKFKEGRAKIEEKILTDVSADLKANKYGMELMAVKVKRVNYIESVKNTVYERMRSERKRIAMLFESEAEEERNRIVGLTQKELDQIEGQMEQKAAEIRGTAEAQVIAMTAEAYGKNPEFYGLLRRLEVFEKALDAETHLILSTDSDLLRLINDASGTFGK